MSAKPIFAPRSGLGVRASSDGHLPLLSVLFRLSAQPIAWGQPTTRVSRRRTQRLELTGSVTTRTQVASTLKLNAVSMIASPGNVTRHHAVWSYSRPWASISPHDDSGG